MKRKLNTLRKMTFVVVDTGPFKCHLGLEVAAADIAAVEDRAFRRVTSDDATATEIPAHGIRNICADWGKLERQIQTSVGG